MGIHGVNWEATFKLIHPRSRVYFDGREVLKGADWARRKKELWQRAKGRCEYDRCTETSGDPCHVIPRHPVRDDRLSNLKFYCRRHHEMTDKAMAKRKVKWTPKGDA